MVGESIVTKPNKLLDLLQNANSISVMALGIVLGLLLGGKARWIEPLSLPALTVAMSVSMTGIVASDFRSWRKVAYATVLSIILTFFIQGGLILVLARPLVRDVELWLGFVLLAATPPGIAVVPFSYVLEGDAVLALVGYVATYLAAIVIMPMTAVFLGGSVLIQPMRLLTILVQLVLIPLGVSRLITISPLKISIERWSSTIVNWAFALVIFTAVGLNRDGLLQQSQMLLLIALIGLASSLGLGLVLEWILEKLQVNRAVCLSSVLIGTIKNTSLTAATVLSLFAERVALPAAVITVTNALYLIWLGIWWGGQRRRKT